MKCSDISSTLKIRFMRVTQVKGGEGQLETWSSLEGQQGLSQKDKIPKVGYPGEMYFEVGGGWTEEKRNMRIPGTRKAKGKGEAMEKKS